MIKMRKLFMITTVLALFISCGPGKRETQEVNLDEKVEQALKNMEEMDKERKNKEVEEPVADEPVEEPAVEETPKKGAKVKISTPYGDMIAVLYDETPKHKANFLKLAKQGFYNDLLFHRVIKGFMIQGGDPESKGASADKQLGSGGPGYTIPAEINPKFFHKKGALAAARTGGPANPEKRSSGSQFYIVQGNVGPGGKTEAAQKAYSTIGGTPFLDGEYTVFGEVIKGLDVIDKIAAVKTAPGDRPVKDVKMKVTVLN